MDPTGLAPVSSGVNADIITIYTTGPSPHIVIINKKSLFYKRFLLFLTPDETRNIRIASICILSIADLIILSNKGLTLLLWPKEPLF